MVKKDSSEGGGFARYWQESGSILLPLATIASIKADAAIALAAEDMAVEEEAAIKKQAAIEFAALKAKTPASSPPKAIATPGPRDVEIFKHASVEELLDNQFRMDSTQKQTGQKIFEKLVNGGNRWRTIPSVKPADILALAGSFMPSALTTTGMLAAPLCEKTWCPSWAVYQVQHAAAPS